MAATLSPDALARLKKVMQGMNPGGTTGEPATLGSPTDRGPSLPGGQPVMADKLAMLARKRKVA